MFRIMLRTVMLVLVAGTAGAAIAALPVAPDQSLTSAALIARGAPATDREWTASDYERIVAVLQPLGRATPRQLPRFDSPNSGSMMRRIVADANFKILHDRALPLQSRLGQAVNLSQAVSQLTGVYIDATNNSHEAFDRELVELMSLMVKVNLELWAIADELLSGMTAEERAKRADAIGTMQSGTAQVVDGALTTFTEHEVYRITELRRLATLIANTLPRLIPRLTRESQAEASVHLRKVVAGTVDTPLRAQLEALLKAMEKRK